MLNDSNFQALSQGENCFRKDSCPGNFPGGPVVKIYLLMQGVQIPFLVGKLRSHMPQGQKTKNRSNIVTNSIKTFKNGPHKKNIFNYKRRIIKKIKRTNTQIE